MTHEANDARTGMQRRTFLKGVAAGAVGLGLAGKLTQELRAEEEGEEAPPASTAGVPTRVLGRTKAPVSVIAYGGGGLRPEDVRLLATAVERGVSFVDVAWGYGRGQAELAVGEYLKTCTAREKLFVNTKASGFRPPAGSAKEVTRALRTQVQESLRRLQTEYVDMLMWPHGATSVADLGNEAMQEALKTLQEEKLVRFLGVSSHANYQQVCSAVVDGGFYDALLTVINVSTQDHDASAPPESAPALAEEGGGRQRGRSIERTRELLQRAKEKNIGVMAMKVANPGFLGADVEERLARAFPEETSWSRHQKLYAYGLAQEGVHTVVVGIRSALHLKEALAVGQAAATR